MTTYEEALLNPASKKLVFVRMDLRKQLFGWGAAPILWAPLDDPDDPLATNIGGPLTMVRATDGAYLRESTDVLTIVGSDILRIEQLGALIEGQGENLILQSRQFDTTWSGTATPTKDQTGVDGVANSAWTLTDDSVISSLFRRQDVTVADDALDRVVSIYIGKDSDETRFPEVQFNIVGGGTTVQHAVRINTKTGELFERVDSGSNTFGIEDYNDNFWRLYVESTNDAGGNTTVRINIFPAAAPTLTGAGSATTIGTIIADAAQLELGVLPSSFILTTVASATRNFDDLSVAVSGSFDQTLGSLYMEYVQPQITAQVDKISDGTNAMLYSATNADILTDQANTLTYAGSNIVAGTRRRICVTWDASTSLMKMVVDGGAVESQTFDGNMSLGATLDIGHTGGANSFMHIKPLKIWDVALTEAQMIEETTP